MVPKIWTKNVHDLCEFRSTLFRILVTLLKLELHAISRLTDLLIKEQKKNMEPMKEKKEKREPKIEWNKCKQQLLRMNKC